ncbi:histidinol phosphate aminotransferase, chloroplastic-like protein [Tanacetum coccineum]
MASSSSSLSSSTAAGVKQPQLSGDSFIRPHLRQLKPYQPILPFEVLSTRLGRKPEDIVKLDANENPYGPPPEVFEALGAMKFPYIYPDPESRTLRAALAHDSGLESEYILVGCGADELIDLIMRCVLEPGDSIVDCPPTFTMYEFDAAVNCASVIKAVPRKKDFSLDVERITEVIEHEKPKIIFLTSPNNPDGSVISDDVLLKILELPILVVLDEAYIEFSGLDSKMEWVKKHENLIVLRTFSKRAGLAGLRVGYGAFPLSIIEYLWRAKQPYNVSVAAEVSACAALQNPDYLEKVKVSLVQERERLYTLLKEVPFLNPYPSYSNFILCEVTAGRDAKKLKDHGVHVKIEGEGSVVVYNGDQLEDKAIEKGIQAPLVNQTSRWISVVKSEILICLEELIKRARAVKSGFDVELVAKRSFAKVLAIKFMVFLRWGSRLGDMADSNESTTTFSHDCILLYRGCFKWHRHDIQQELNILHQQTVTRAIVSAKLIADKLNEPLHISEDLAQMGVMIRHYSNKELKGYVRVSVGKPEQTDILMDCIGRLS